LNAEQLDKVESAIKAADEEKQKLQADVDALNATIEELKAKVEELNKQPGATTSNVTEKGGEECAPGADAKADAQAILKQLI
jgi:peptidoglycan hydrolase CwlO-like protein